MPSSSSRSRRCETNGSDSPGNASNCRRMLCLVSQPSHLVRRKQPRYHRACARAAARDSSLGKGGSNHACAGGKSIVILTRHRGLHCGVRSCKTWTLLPVSRGFARALLPVSRAPSDTATTTAQSHGVKITLEFRICSPQSPAGLQMLLEQHPQNDAGKKNHPGYPPHHRERSRSNKVERVECVNPSDTTALAGPEGQRVSQVYSAPCYVSDYAPRMFRRCAQAPGDARVHRCAAQRKIASPWTSSIT